MVLDALTASPDWSASALKPYVEERKERLRRLRFVTDITVGLFCEYGELGRARRRRFFEKSPSEPALLAHLVASLAGPENQPPEVFTPEHRAYVLSAISAQQGHPTG